MRDWVIWLTGRKVIRLFREGGRMVKEGGLMDRQERRSFKPDDAAGFDAGMASVEPDKARRIDR